MIERQSIINAIDLSRRGDKSLLGKLSARLVAGEEIETSRTETSRTESELIAYLRQHHRALVERAEEDLDNYGALGQANSHLEMILDEWNGLRGHLSRDPNVEADQDHLLNAIRIYRLVKDLNARCDITGDLRAQMLDRQMEARGLPNPLAPKEEANDGPND